MTGKCCHYYDLRDRKPSVWFQQYPQKCSPGLYRNCQVKAHSKTGGMVWLPQRDDRRQSCRMSEQKVFEITASYFASNKSPCHMCKCLHCWKTEFVFCCLIFSIRRYAFYCQQRMVLIRKREIIYFEEAPNHSYFSLGETVYRTVGEDTGLTWDSPWNCVEICGIPAWPRLKINLANISKTSVLNLAI